MKKEERVMLVTEIIGLPVPATKFKKIGDELGKEGLIHEDYFSTLHLLENLEVLSATLPLNFEPATVIEELKESYGELNGDEDFFEVKEVLRSKFADINEFSKWLSTVELEEYPTYNFLVPDYYDDYNLEDLDKEELLAIKEVLAQLGQKPTDLLEKVIKEKKQC